MWQLKNNNWEYVAVDEPEGQIVVKTKQVEINTESVLINEPEGQVVVKKRKSRKAKQF